SPVSASRPVTFPPSPVTTVAPCATGKIVLGLGARHSSLSCPGGSLGSGSSVCSRAAVERLVALLSLCAHTSAPTTTTTATTTAVTLLSRGRGHGERAPARLPGSRGGSGEAGTGQASPPAELVALLLRRRRRRRRAPDDFPGAEESASLVRASGALVDCVTEVSCFASEDEREPRVRFRGRRLAGDCDRGPPLRLPPTSSAFSAESPARVRFASGSLPVASRGMPRSVYRCSDVE